MIMFNRNQFLFVTKVLVLAFFIGNGECDSICPNGITNITATSGTGSLIYPSSGDYGINETKCWKIEIPDDYALFAWRFDRFDIERCTGCNCDYFQISISYNNLHLQSKDCGRFSYNYLHEYMFNVDWNALKVGLLPVSTVYFRFVSDDTVNYKGFNISFIAGSLAFGKVSYLNASEDETISFGTPKAGIKNYPENYAQQWFLIVPEGRHVQIDFDIFELEDSKDCKNDYVQFRRGLITVGDPKTLNGQFSDILTKRLCGNTKPSTIIQSVGNIVWVQFKSDSNSTTVYKGFKASFKAGQGRLSVSSPLTFLFVSALIMMVSKHDLF